VQVKQNKEQTMRLVIELLPEDILNLQKDIYKYNLESNAFIKRELFDKGIEQNEANLDEAGMFSEIFDECSGDILDDPTMFTAEES